MNFENLRLITQKTAAKTRKQKRINLGQELKNLENNLTSEEHFLAIIKTN